MALKFLVSARGAAELDPLAHALEAADGAPELNVGHQLRGKQSSATVS